MSYSIVARYPGGRIERNLTQGTLVNALSNGAVICLSDSPLVPHLTANNFGSPVPMYLGASGAPVSYFQQGNDEKEAPLESIGMRLNQAFAERGARERAEELRQRQIDMPSRSPSPPPRLTLSQGEEEPLLAPKFF